MRRRLLYSGPYVKVKPEEIQWITMDFEIEYKVKSNTNWIVK